MSTIKEFSDFIDSWDWNPVSIDKNHALLLYGVLTSLKPQTVLEIGIGAGFTSQTILHALKYNGTGNLTCVDNWYDWKGKEPEHAKQLRNMGAEIIAPVSEEEFVKHHKTTYDVVFVDGDHNNGGKWAEKTYDLVKPGGTLFAHDVLMESYPTLTRFQELAEERGYMNITFDKKSKSTEWCHRGLIMVVKNK